MNLNNDYVIDLNRQNEITQNYSNNYNSLSAIQDKIKKIFAHAIKIITQFLIKSFSRNFHAISSFIYPNPEKNIEFFRLFFNIKLNKNLKNARSLNLSGEEFSWENIEDRIELYSEALCDDPIDEILMDENLSEDPDIILCKTSLTSIPESFGNLTHLEELNLSYNKLSHLPTSIGNLKKLRKLNLLFNKLVSLPDSITDLENLVMLHIDINELCTLPNCIGKLKNLTKLSLFSNSLLFLPYSIGDLKNLTILNLYNNQLRSLPSSIKNLQNLTKLYLSKNFFESLPNTIGNLTNLTTLDLSTNHLQSLPDAIGNLTNLTTLDLSSNHLRSLPDAIGNLTNLTMLDLSNNSFSSIPESLFNLRRCTIYMEEHRISEEGLRNLETRTSALDYEGPEFIFSIREPEDFNEYDDSNREAVFEDWLSPNSLTKIKEQREDIQRNAASWLYRLNDAKDYKNPSLKKAMKETVEALFDWILFKANDDEQLYAWTTIEAANDTCGDGASLVLNELHLFKELSNRELSVSVKELESFVIGLTRISLLYQAAENIILSQGKGSDRAEVILILQTTLREPLELPLITKGMIFTELAFVSKHTINNIKESIIALTENRAQCLANHPLWQNRIKKTNLDFEKRKSECEQNKKEWLEKYSENAENHESEFKNNKETIWNPWFVLTEEILERGTFK